MDLSQFSAADKLTVQEGMVQADNLGQDVDVLLADGTPFTITPGPINWTDDAAWDVDWARGMKCIDFSICGYVMHSVQDETLHMETAHKEQDNRNFNNN